MRFLGRHVTLSSLKSDLQHYQINAAQVFTKAPQQWFGKPMQDTFRLKYDPEKYYICAHAGYLINMANKTSQSRTALLHEANRCAHLGIPDLVVHPGSGSNLDVLSLLNSLEEEWPLGVTLLLENTAGQGKYLGGRIEELQYIIDHVNHPMPLSVCYDTAHAWGWGSSVEEIKVNIKHPMVKVVHLNDSLVPNGCKKDRHANLCHGTMPIELFKWIAQNVTVPLIMETPETYDMQDLEIFRELIK